MQTLPANTPAVFNFDSHAVRTMLIDDAPWFVAADVCAALGVSNVSQTLTRLDADEQQTLISNEGIHQGRGNPNVNIINESGLYNLVLGSRKPEAKRFKKWVTSEVLPAIRKTGRYEPDANALVTNDQRVFLNRLVHERFTREPFRTATFKEIGERFGVSSLREVRARQFMEVGLFTMNRPVPRISRTAFVNALPAPIAAADPVLTALASLPLETADAWRAKLAMAVAEHRAEVALQQRTKKERLDSLAAEIGKLPRAMLPKILAAVSARLCA